MSRATLYVIPASHPAIAVRRMLEREVPPILPAEWLEPLRATAAA